MTPPPTPPAPKPPAKKVEPEAELAGALLLVKALRVLGPVAYESNVDLRAEIAAYLTERYPDGLEDNCLICGNGSHRASA